MTQISAGRKTKDGQTSKDGPPSRPEKVRMDHVLRENIAVQTPMMGKRVASETNHRNGNIRLQAQHREQ
jgi:hypothetical protein